jgi:hypothetical protein
MGAFRLHTDSQGKIDPENGIHEVGGSIPPGSTNPIKDLATLVNHHAPK